jgi:DNA uptake protein ComE-like DNA-binding protein
MAKILLAAACILSLTGCFSPNNTDSLREHTADATAAAKRDAGAIASGIAEGLARKGPLDLNQATVKQLTALPGISNELANSIVEGRPYTSTTELVRKRILSKAAFSRIKAQIIVK